MCLELRALVGVVEVTDDLVDGVEGLAHHLVDQLGSAAAAVLVHFLHDALFGSVDRARRNRRKTMSTSLFYTKLFLEHHDE